MELFWLDKWGYYMLEFRLNNSYLLIILIFEVIDMMIGLKKYQYIMILVQVLKYQVMEKLMRVIVCQ